MNNITKQLNQENRHRLAIIAKSYSHIITPDIFSPQLKRVKYNRLALALLLAQNAKR